LKLIVRAPLGPRGARSTLTTGSGGAPGSLSPSTPASAVVRSAAEESQVAEPVATVEAARTGRARCRGCGRPLAKGELRLGERVPSGFREGDATLWFHLECAAYKRPEPLLAALPSAPLPEAERARLAAAAEPGLVHRRLPRIDGAERAPSGRARCRACREPIPTGTLRIRLVFFEENQFSAGGYLHPGCAGAYFETTDLLPRLARFGPLLSPEDLEELRRSLA
jgi:hypothetical protein